MKKLIQWYMHNPFVIHISKMSPVSDLVKARCLLSRCLLSDDQWVALDEMVYTLIDEYIRDHPLVLMHDNYQHGMLEHLLPTVFDVALSVANESEACNDDEEDDWE